MISARLRLVNLQAAILTLATGRHFYISTSCLEGAHDHCRSSVAADGNTKTPGTCKLCSAVCSCPICEHDS